MTKKKDKNKRIDHFTNCVYDYVERFGLKDYELHVFVDDLEDNRGLCKYEVHGRISSISVDYEFLFDDETTLDDIRKVAFHEVCELLLGDFGKDMARMYSDEYIDIVTHRVIRRLENFVFAP